MSLLFSENKFSSIRTDIIFLLLHFMTLYFSRIHSAKRESSEVQMRGREVSISVEKCSLVKCGKV